MKTPARTLPITSTQPWFKQRFTHVETMMKLGEEKISSQSSNRQYNNKKILIIVFSKAYALSRWCLDELVMIMERKRNTDCIILPVFYEVRNQTGSFAAAFVDHEKRFKKEMEQVNGWRIALKEVADLGGMVLGDG